MVRSTQIVGVAAVFLFLVAGCAVDSFSLTALGVGQPDGPVVSGSLDATTVAAKQVLSDRGLFVTMHRDSDVVKLTSTTSGGKRFTLVLKACKTDHGEETQASIQWEKEADAAFWIQLAGDLSRPAPARKPDAGKELFPPPSR